MKTVNKRLYSLLRDNIIPFIFIILYMIICNHIFGYLCPSMIVLGIPCPGCGLTRACIALIMLDFKQAFKMNPIIFLILPIVLSYVIMKLKGIKNFTALYYPTAATIIIAIITFFIRFSVNFGSEPFVINHNALIFKLLR